MAGFTVADMADDLVAAIEALQPRAWGLVGHSMGAKVTTIVAKRAEAGEAGLTGLLGLALLAGSPPSPEPMDEAQRGKMLSWFRGNAEEAKKQAEGYISNNVGPPIDTDVFRRAVGEVLKAAPRAWRAWLEQGSREDWSDRVGVLRTPTLIVAGAKDADLGPDAQMSLMSKHFSQARLITLEDAAHLLPLERPREISALIEEHFSRVRGIAPRIDPTYDALIRSDRVSRRTRDVLLERAKPDDPAYKPVCITEQELAVLRAALDRVLPQGNTGWIDLAARLDKQLGAGGDGWRFAELPPDKSA